MAEVMESSPVHYHSDESIVPADLEDATAATGTSVFSTSDFMTAGDSSFDETPAAADTSQMVNQCYDGKVSVKKRRNCISQKNEAVDMKIFKDGHNNESNNSNNEQLSVLAVLITTFRRSLVACRANREEPSNMEISWPTNVRHVAHVTFDRFNGFLGLPVEFELEIPRRVPSARFLARSWSPFFIILADALSILIFYRNKWNYISFGFRKRHLRELLCISCITFSFYPQIFFPPHLVRISKKNI